MAYITRLFSITGYASLTYINECVQMFGTGGDSSARTAGDAEQDCPDCKSGHPDRTRQPPLALYGLTIRETVYIQGLFSLSRDVTIRDIVSLREKHCLLISLFALQYCFLLIYL